VEFFVQGGRAVKVRGNQLSKANSGYCCPRGHIMLQQAYDPDRIKVPMKRTNPEKGRGIDPKFVPITGMRPTYGCEMMNLEKQRAGEIDVYARPTPRHLQNCSMAHPQIYGTPTVQAIC
jgi:hypothetical protein